MKIHRTNGEVVECTVEEYALLTSMDKGVKKREVKREVGQEKLDTPLPFYKRKKKIIHSVRFPQQYKKWSAVEIGLLKSGEFDKIQRNKAAVVQKWKKIQEGRDKNE